MHIKSKEAIRQIEKSGLILGRILSNLAKMCQAGITTWEIDREAEKMILKAGGRPAFKGYRNSPSDSPFPTTICASVNHELVHACARKDVRLKTGDIFSIDIGMEYPYKKNCRGFFTDTAITVPIGPVSEEVKKLLRVTRGALEEGIKASRPGNSVADIGRAIENYVKSQGKYGIVRDLVGHGVGYEVHEEPRIPNYYDRKLSGWKLEPGMVIAIEPMISLGSWAIKTGPDGWAIEMADKSLCAHFEHTIIIGKKTSLVATYRPNESKET
ncbi:MAG: type I methionyl aminopeptidase [Candidatus Magasanikbacteria bacterium CG10_big_fil_rev_8_21_14_0_10_40_10]|uniref:Methionine aminopeptidase n=1 Tax=Candidatus Magasanikbacteria bacterium CG10_big_fil_rev_8_21_14_0_10_40_10 TaxID=1974648 RepID=A0A2M6W584_9BACT|nr:MAG: type I methionyl aminopeptidase [Candidatus Magasanikbacteria bacterium CG10_big_fil_rev_8_21_14_0_10_40_10]